MHAQNVVNASWTIDQALTAYFGYLLDNQAVSGLLLEIQWNDLQPSDPGPLLGPKNPDSFNFSYVDDAFNAIIAWNIANPSKPKTLQLDVTPGFNSPLTLNTLQQKGSDWLLKYLFSCDGLFTGSTTVVQDCGYTTIFYRTENPPVIQTPLPMPWNPTYKGYWQYFLSALNSHIALSKYKDEDYASVFVSIGVGGRRPLRRKSFFRMALMLPIVQARVPKIRMPAP
jgi:hypothetical protein